MNTYDKHGYSFVYPENWQLDESEMEEGAGSVSLSAPGGEFWVLTVRPAGFDPTKLADDALETMVKEYRDIEYSAISRDIAGYTLTGYEMNFFFLDLTSTAMVLTYSDENRTFAIFWQCGDVLALTPEPESFSYEDVFEAMTTSLLRNLSRT
ncbi:MAG: hypothetical protein FWC43_04370 [Planctomycetaceae bacterium]|nr:hypothetical protein [Planctomycetaceae bacterium]